MEWLKSPLLSPRSPGFLWIAALIVTNKRTKTHRMQLNPDEKLFNLKTSILTAIKMHCHCSKRRLYEPSESGCPRMQCPLSTSRYHERSNSPSLHVVSKAVVEEYSWYKLYTHIKHPLYKLWENHRLVYV